MQRYKAGEQARIIEMPGRGTRFVGELVRVVAWGGLGQSPDDVAVVTRSGSIILVKQHQLAIASK